MEKLIFNVPHFRLYEPTDDQLVAANIPDDIAGKPRFCIEMMLARLDVPNGNGHRLKRDEVEKALVALGEKPFIPANLNHETMPFGTSTALWIDDKGKVHPELMLRAVYWQRYIDEAKLAEIMAAYDNATLGGSWEIDPPYSLKPDSVDANILDVSDFGISGFGIIVGKEPAESSTKGTAQITAQLGEDNDQQVARSTKYKIAIKSEGNITKPHDDMSDSQYGDCVNYRFAMHPDHIEAEIGLFNQPGQREAGGYTSTEWAKIGNRIAKITGYKYKAGRIEDMNAANTDVVRVSRWGDLPVDMLQSIRCPVCGERGVLKKLDFIKGVFLLECDHSEFDRELIAHQYEVAITVTPVGQTASYQLVASEEESVGDFGEEIRVMFRSIEDTFNEEVFDEMTDEEKTQMIQDALEQDRKVREDAEAAQANIDDKIAKAVAEQIEAARKDAVEEYKKSEALAAKRLDEIDEIMSFETEADRVEAREKLSGMSDERYVSYKENKLLKAELAKLKAAAEVEPVDLVALAAIRLDELEKIMPFENEADKAVVSEKLAGMSDEDFTSYKEERVLKVKDIQDDPAGSIVARLSNGQIDPAKLPVVDPEFLARI